MASYVYPDYPKQLLLNSGSIVIGNSYATHPDGNLSPFNFGTVIEPDWSDFDITVNTSESNAYRAEIFELKNGYKLILDMWYEVNMTAISYSSHWLDENGNIVDLSLQGIAGRFSWRLGLQYENRYSYYYYYKPKIFLTARYPVNTIPGVSEADSFGVELYFPTYYNRYIGINMVTLENNLDQMTTNNQTERQYIFKVPYEGDRYDCIPAYAPLGISGIYFDTFATFIKTHGNPFEGEVYDMEEPDPEPAGSDDTSTPGGGHGNYDNTSDPIDFPSLPNGGALESGAVNAYLISKQSLQTIIGKLWSNSIFDILTMWQKSITDPMDAIVSLHAVPVIPSITTAKNVVIGNFDTEVPTPTITSQYVEVDCGTLNIKEYWGSALDYSPYTKAEIFLPFIGVKDVSIEDVMNSVLHIKYHVDILTGDCIAFIKCGLSVLYHFTGNCRMTIPLSSKTTDALQNTIGETGKLLTGAAMMGATGGAALAAGMTISSAANVASSKIRTGRTGDISGSASLMDSFTPYVIIHRPVQSLAKDYNKFKGYPSNITRKLSTLSGYTEVEHIHLQGIPNATDEEMNEIVRLLKQGVII